MGELNPKSYPFIFRETLYGKGKKTSSKDAEELPDDPPTDLSFHGTNLKNITVLVDDSERVYKGLEFALLKNILKALDLSENDVAILDANAKGSELSNIKKQLEPKVIISFGEGFAQTPGNKNMVFDNGSIKILITDTLQALEGSKELKLALWAELKKLKEALKQI